MCLIKRHGFTPGAGKGRNLSKMLKGAIVNIYKPLGLTPLGALNLWRARHPEWQGVSMTYTGRLDPMAEGVLVVLIGEALRKQSQFQKQDKVYQADILFGATTDTYDVLGLPANLVNTNNLALDKVKAELNKLQTSFKFKLPPYSSYKVQGKPLFWWALMKRLPEIKIPERTVKIYQLNYLQHQYLTNRQLLLLVQKKIGLVKGDFRQKEIIKTWRALADKQPNNIYLIVSLRLHCQSGTYLRALAHHLGDKLGVGAILWNLVRERVGDYTISQSERVD